MNKRGVFLFFVTAAVTIAGCGDSGGKFEGKNRGRDGESFKTDKEKVDALERMQYFLDKGIMINVPVENPPKGIVASVAARCLKLHEVAPSDKEKRDLIIECNKFTNSDPN